MPLHFGQHTRQNEPRNSDGWPTKTAAFDSALPRWGVCEMPSSYKMEAFEITAKESPCVTVRPF
ncbi:unnamed protein product [Ceratitis capitata]|uniref:(Mediterranean fruit fly) hypothetical protein n=1 Tax=Ceratitis capitata TaxID=7213 RepID=A0A811V1C9_CERCA|nr:unnamed protein product [Ceratitis capitata]